MYYILVNPSSRSGRGMNLWKNQVEPTLVSEQIGYNVYFSAKAGDICELAKKICSTVNEKEINFIILGGDGTMNEALQGMDFTKNITIGYIPTGSSNDLARDMKIPKDPKEALNIILHTGTKKPMDLGQVTYDDGATRLFSVSAGIGFDAGVCAEAMNSKIKDFLNKIGLGKLTYLGIALKQICSSGKTTCTITFPDQTKVSTNKFLFVSEHIHRFEGGGFMFAPKATGNDGKLHLCMVGGISKPKIIFALPFAFKGKHLIFKGINAYETNEIVIETSVPLYVHTDGEVTRKATKYSVKCLPGALNIIQ